MDRELGQLLFPDEVGQHMWVDDDNEENEFEIRRPYRIQVHANINSWDDVDFYGRFRLRKQTFLMVLALVAPALQHPNPR